MQPKQLILRGYAVRRGDLWVGVNIDLCLAAQGQTLEEVRTKLHDQVAEYLYDAVVGDDQEHAEYLLNRKAPIGQVFTYHAIRIFKKLYKPVKARCTPLSDVLPVWFKSA